MSHLKSFITVNTKVTGFHYWDKAPEPVRFLGDLHRHTFHIKVSLWVRHSDRAREFTLVKKDIEAYFEGHAKIYDGYDFDGHSCEQLAESLRLFLIERRKYKPIEFRLVSFSEDGEFEGGFEITK